MLRSGEVFGDSSVARGRGSSGRGRGASGRGRGACGSSGGEHSTLVFGGGGHARLNSLRGRGSSSSRPREVELHDVVDDSNDLNDTPVELPPGVSASSLILLLFMIFALCWTS